VQFFEGGWAVSAATGQNVADQRFGLHNADIRFFADDQEIINDVSRYLSAVSPVIRQPDLMDGAAIDAQRPNSWGDENTRLD
jgi:hypothetical protein